MSPGTVPGEEYNSELPPHTIQNLAAALPGNLNGRADASLSARPAVGTRPGLSGPRAAESAAHPATHTVEISTPGVARASRPATGVVAAPSVPAADSSAAAHSRRERLRTESGPAPESASMLTSDRLLAVNRKTKPPPHGTWNSFVYAATLHLVNLGDSAKVRAHNAMDERIRREFKGGTRFVPILTRKGGVGKTTVTALLGMALADAREDRIIAVDANPDRGTLSERVSKQTRSTVRDVVSKAASIGGFTDFSALVSRDATRLDILASDTDPLLSEAFDENDYNVVADLAARYYSIMLTDCGTGIVHSVMRATLQRADSIVIVSGGSVDEARLASETLTWLEANGYGDLVRNAIVALNTATQGTNLVKLEEIESHFRSRVREIVRIPYDPQLAAGSVISYNDLKPITQLAARTLAALVVEGLPADRAV
ncbi:MinD-like ATPase involved in chromosome partitioning or flagellar assembly [Cryobacterium sp. MP_M5]|uniref:MinD/ParA family ATP-binding protein n=1 Tax=unclassified Cryobacterium TaxID=2649013 RepID=UPI001A1BD757|nr:MULTISPECIES: MinD/ParA family protein [unclassified Cryobacterium]MBG6058368.1 MinD-like ATPase involved in chromosome partitioning or flagellar assembly [Cryobacterium sp. MP_M3]MEC5177775.1 MinD-like ATPase involved in chromosome partitioning or flagellar assembly [Cryobacterium sp. MP_M5]